MATETVAYDPADFLVDDATITAYLTVSLEEDDPSYFVRALGAVARAKKRMPEVSAELGMSVESLDAVLRDGKHVDLDSILVITRRLGIRLSVTVPVESGSLQAAVA
jgi:probable addiction module antidote protein